MGSATFGSRPELQPAVFTSLYCDGVRLTGTTQFEDAFPGAPGTIGGTERSLSLLRAMWGARRVRIPSIEETVHVGSAFVAGCDAGSCGGIAVGGLRLAAVFARRLWKLVA